eukprot:13554136-Heterocapsa_arctica.AAC.1
MHERVDVIDDVYVRRAGAQAPIEALPPLAGCGQELSALRESAGGTELSARRGRELEKETAGDPSAMPVGGIVAGIRPRSPGEVQGTLPRSPHIRSAASTWRTSLLRQYLYLCLRWIASRFPHIRSM